MINIPRPVTRTSFLDSRLRLRNRTNRLIERGMSVSDHQLDPAHIGRPGVSTSAIDREANRPEAA
ncbi:MAG: hypothetical protein AAF845_01430 [Bacteroidota bacterium]